LIVVSDTSPILNLERIGHLELLPKLFDRITIPDRVFQELLAGPSSFTVPDWLVTASAKDTDRVSALCLELDPGEAEAIVLAQELAADLLLIDEKRGRRIAKASNLRMTGLLGILIEAKDASLIPAVRPVLDLLVASARFRVSERLYWDTLEIVDEI